MTLLIGSAGADVEALRDGLDASLEHLPALAPDPDWSWAADLEAWRESTAARPPVDRIVVAAWGSTAAEPRFDQLGSEQWLVDGEQRLAVWATALAAAVRRCADDGCVVAVVDRAHTLDSASHTVLQMVADGVVNLVRSIARIEGGRGVRINAVTTAARIALPKELLAPAPLLGYPGTISTHVVPVVHQLLAEGSTGLTGHVVDVDFGRISP
ncbi:MAG TPA: hypothetical protein VHB69_14835 [Mycobacteriales bacterium]|nr:hypothetical protein [Mycobacteriales bacterium]